MFVEVHSCLRIENGLGLVNDELMIDQLEGDDDDPAGGDLLVMAPSCRGEWPRVDGELSFLSEASQISFLVAGSLAS